MKTIKVALIQNRLQFGGRLQVAIHMIKYFNKIGVTPDFYCFSSRFTEQDIREKYGHKIQFNLKYTAFDLKVPFEWNVVLFNFIIGKYVKGYDLVIDHNNTSFMSTVTAQTLSYVHYPRKDRLVRKEKSIHFPEVNRTFFDIKSDPFKLLHVLYNFNRRVAKNQYLVANSFFTKNAIQCSYPDYSVNIPVLYPPIELAKVVEETERQANLVISLGRFTSHKRQKEQIQIAASFPKLEFVLMGFINSQEYYDECLNEIGRLGLKNVKLLGDSAKEVVNSYLSKGTFFVHSVINEPFGITTVQAIANGCIPLVPDYGGQKEIVDNPSLLYRNKQDAISKLENLIKLNSFEKKTILEDLTQKIQTFKADVFENQFDEIVKELLPSQFN